MLSVLAKLGESLAAGIFWVTQHAAFIDELVDRRETPVLLPFGLRVNYFFPA